MSQELRDFDRGVRAAQREIERRGPIVVTLRDVPRIRVVSIEDRLAEMDAQIKAMTARKDADR